MSPILDGIPPWASRVLYELPEDLVLASVGHEQRLGLLLARSHEEGHVLVPLGLAGLVDDELPDMAHVDPRSRVLDVVLDQAPEAGVVLPHGAGQRPHRQRGSHGHHVRLEEEREAAPVPCPGDGDREHPVLGAGGAGQRRDEVRLVLEKVQVPPPPFAGVVGRARRLAPRAGKSAAAGEGEPDVELTSTLDALGIEDDGLHLPRSGETERGAEEGVRVRPRSVAGAADGPEAEVLRVKRRTGTGPGDAAASPTVNSEEPVCGDDSLRSGSNSNDSWHGTSTTQSRPLARSPRTCASTARRSGPSLASRE